MSLVIDLIDLRILGVSITQSVGRVCSDRGDRLDRPDRQGGIYIGDIKITENLKKVSIKSISGSKRWESKPKVIDTISLSLSIKSIRRSRAM